MTEKNQILNEDYQQRIQELARMAEQGNAEGTERLIDELTNMREQSLFNELGKLTRQFHEALNSFRLDARISNLAEKDFPDAKERLRYVITMTNTSADRSLTAAEESLPLCESIGSQAANFKDEWERFTRREMSADEFRTMSGRLIEFFDQISDGSDQLKNNLNEVIMAQDFQDLTGQIITRVISLVDEMEISLVELIRISGQNLAPHAEAEKKEEEDRIKAEGPAVPGLDTEGTVSGQDEVDDLLSSLGF